MTVATKPRLLIDGDQFLFKATVALEREVQWDDQNHVLYSNANECWINLNGMLQRIFERFDTTDHVLCFSGALPYFRHDLFPEYKPGRSRKPLCYARMRQMVEKDFNVLTMDGLEADDIMGILATKPEGFPQTHKIIVSQDKDMKSIPGTLWDGVDLISVTEEEADLFHLTQTLTGDKTDGYSGCPGVGPVKADSILHANAGPPRWKRVVATYEKAGLTEADALLQARLARILRWSDWDSERKKPILWTPPST